MANFCNKCGAELFEGGAFCMKCGAPVQQAVQSQQQPDFVNNNPMPQTAPVQPVSTGNMTQDFIERRKRERGQY